MSPLGVAVGFVLSPSIAPSECFQKDQISIGKRNVAYILTAVNVVVFALVAFTFQNTPKLPPSLSESQRKKDNDQSHIQVVLSMLKNPNFILRNIMYCLMVGSYFTLGTTLNNLILRFYPRDCDFHMCGQLTYMSHIQWMSLFGSYLDPFSHYWYIRLPLSVWGSGSFSSTPPASRYQRKRKARALPSATLSPLPGVVTERMNRFVQNARSPEGVDCL
ncbi:putative MFS-type transporter C09D4.1 [Caerostris darwini]|uniref:MFS-type transporter C09D4.1 n=1 Tax=Caerostris darwini TaxID=1538125 RepID=A0AAV4PS77_9ARAC|nr:putative MFS-type transporter C09D4.1 [Caerostris darwini]